MNDARLQTEDEGCISVGGLVHEMVWLNQSATAEPSAEELRAARSHCLKQIDEWVRMPKSAIDTNEELQVQQTLLLHRLVMVVGIPLDRSPDAVRNDVECLVDALNEVNGSQLNLVEMRICGTDQWELTLESEADLQRIYRLMRSILPFVIMKAVAA